jgi:hypothetical protein
MNSLQGILPTSCFRFSIGQPFATRLRVLENSNLSVAVHAVGELIELIVKDMRAPLLSKEECPIKTRQRQY